MGVWWSLVDISMGIDVVVLMGAGLWSVDIEQQCVCVVCKNPIRHFFGYHVLDR